MVLEGRADVLACIRDFLTQPTLCESESLVLYVPVGDHNSFNAFVN